VSIENNITFPFKIRSGDFHLSPWQPEIAAANKSCRRVALLCYFSTFIMAKNAAIKQSRKSWTAE